MVYPTTSTGPAALPDLDPVLTLAQTMHSTPSAYAVLLGAGASIAAGVPSAWGVVEELIRAQQEGEDCGEEPAGWFRAQYGAEPRYETLLETLASTPTERQQLLRGFFESPPAEGEEPHLTEPSPGHRALARLVANGTVRVILTLNFDRLTEAALREAGVEPTVVVTPDDLTGLAPLHTLHALVVHLHGDYLSASTMLNTEAELENYPQNVHDFLDRVLTDYGLLIVGWSAVYDPALRAAVNRQSARFFTPYWVEPAELKPLAEDLRVARGAVKVTATADEALGRLTDAVTALDSRKARHRLTLPVAVATAKRELSGRATAISLHDQIHAEFSRLRQSGDQTRTDFHQLPGDDTVDLLYGRIDEAMTVPCALVATAVYWGRSETDRWWLPEIERYAQPVRGGGLTALLRSVTVPAAHLLYVTGVAAVVAQRWDLLQLLTYHQSTSVGGREPLAYWAATPGYVYAEAREPAPSHRVFAIHTPLFVEHLGLGQDAYEDAWETFELLRFVETVYQLSSTQDDLTLVLQAQQELAEKSAVFDAEQEAGGDVDAVRQDRADAWHEVIRMLGRLANRVPVDRPHLRVEADYSESSFYHRNHPPVVGQKLLVDLRRAQVSHPLLDTGFCGGRYEDLEATLNAVNLVSAPRAVRPPTDRCRVGWASSPTTSGSTRWTGRADETSALASTGGTRSRMRFLVRLVIEIQRSDYLGEDDIVRLEDDFGASSASMVTGQQSTITAGTRVAIGSRGAS